MRISDWSSDVCSSDLCLAGGEIADIPFVDVNAVLVLELPRRVIVAAVGGGDRVAGLLHRYRDGCAAPARPPGHHRHARHPPPPLPPASPSPVPAASPALQAWKHRTCPSPPPTPALTCKQPAKPPT